MDAATWIVVLLIGLALIWIVLIVLIWLLRPKNVSTRELLRLVPDVLRLLGSIVRDGRSPLDVRLVVGGLFVWLISPIDLIPDFFPGVGALDDVVVSVLALRYVRRRLGTPALKDRWRGSADGFSLLERVIGNSPQIY